jgi:hypothetical protein
VVVEREHRRADVLLRKEIRSLTLGKDIKRLKDFGVVSGEDLLSKRFALVLTDYLDERMPWER